MKKERKTIEVMIHLFCSHYHNDPLCSDCKALLDYVLQKIDKCPLRDNKPVCSKCETHCYKPEMRQKIREVMRFAGPKMIYKHPILAIKHLRNKR